MKQFLLTILFLFLFCKFTYSQDKTIAGDTVYWYGNNQKLIDKFELKNFNKQQVDFTFRFRNQGQIVEIIKDGNQISGELINYTFRLNKRTKKRNDTIFNKIEIPKTQAYELYMIIQNSGILELKSDNNIDGWEGGYDGTNYIIEHSNKSKYWFKTYWTPSAQDSLPEALIVQNFINSFSENLQLSDKHTDFENTLPQNGCYSSGGNSITCYITNSFGFGYSGSTKLPFGYNTSMYLNYLGKTHTNLGIEIQHQFDNTKNYDFEFTFGKGDIFLHKKKTKDFITYNYRNRNLNFIDSLNTIKNNQLLYGLSLKNNLILAFGFDYLFQQNKKIGGILYTSKWFRKPQLNCMFTTSVFNTEIYYKVGLSRSFILKRVSFSLGLNYENFKNYNDLNLNISIFI